jgi:hypothetical protein
MHPDAVGVAVVAAGVTVLDLTCLGIARVRWAYLVNHLGAVNTAYRASGAQLASRAEHGRRRRRELRQVRTSDGATTRRPA